MSWITLIKPVATLATTVLSPILEKRKNRKENSELKKDELPQIEFSASRAVQVGGGITLIGVGVKFLEMDCDAPNTTGLVLIGLGVVLAIAMEYLKLKRGSD